MNNKELWLKRSTWPGTERPYIRVNLGTHTLGIIEPQGEEGYRVQADRALFSDLLTACQHVFRLERKKLAARAILLDEAEESLSDVLTKFETEGV